MLTPVGVPVIAGLVSIVALLSLVTFPKPTLAAVVPDLIEEVESWLEEAPRAAPEDIVVTATLLIVPVIFPARIVLSLVLSTLPKAIDVLVIVPLPALLRVTVPPEAVSVTALFKRVALLVRPVPPLSSGIVVCITPALVSPVAILPSVNSAGLEPILLPHVAPTVAPEAGRTAKAFPVPPISAAAILAFDSF